MPSRQDQASSKSKFSGWIFHGHPGVIRAGVRVRSFGQGLRTLENKHVSADIHDPKVRASMTPQSKSIGQRNFGLISRSLHEANAVEGERSSLHLSFLWTRRSSHFHQKH